MSHFAEINGNNIVQRVIVAEQDFIDRVQWVIQKTGYKLATIPVEEFTIVQILLNQMEVLLCVKIMLG